MSLLLKQIEKLAINDNKKQQVELEKELIRKIQTEKDFMARNRLISLYRGLVSNLVRSSGLDKSVGMDTAMQMAWNEFKNIVENKYDLNSKTQPNTFITKSLRGTLQNTSNEKKMKAVKMGQHPERYKRQISIAQNILGRELDRDPSSSEILKFIKGTMKSGKDIDISKIENVLSMNISELSGGMQYGAESGGKFMTYEDQFADQNQRAPVEIRNEAMLEQQIIKLIDDYTQKPNEKKFLKQMYSIGPYKGFNTNIFQASSANNITGYNAKQLLKSFEKHLSEKGVL